MSLDAWSFGAAEAGIAEARSILDRRDATISLAASLDLTPPTGLEGAYEDATTIAALEDAAQQAATMEGSLGAVAEAAHAAAAPRDWLVTLGLIGKDPDAWLTEARADWQQGNLAAAADAAGLVVGTLAVAGDAGRGRAVLIACAIALALLLIALLALAVRHWRRRRSRLLAAAMAGPATPGVEALPLPPAGPIEPRADTSASGPTWPGAVNPPGPPTSPGAGNPPGPANPPGAGDPPGAADQPRNRP
jgi:hypothetical protein